MAIPRFSEILSADCMITYLPRAKHLDIMHKLVCF